MLSDLKVHDIYRNAFVTMTEKLAGFTIYDEEEQTSEYYYDVQIQSKGRFQSVVVCHMEKTLYEALLMGMNSGKTVNAEMKQLFIGEYINVVCGHALTAINNILGVSSRLTLPQVLQHLQETMLQESELKKVFYFASTYGKMRIDMDYMEVGAEGDVFCITKNHVHNHS